MDVNNQDQLGQGDVSRYIKKKSEMTVNYFFISLIIYRAELDPQCPSGATHDSDQGGYSDVSRGILTFFPIPHPLPINCLKIIHSLIDVLFLISL